MNLKFKFFLLFILISFTTSAQQDNIADFNKHYLNDMVFTSHKIFDTQSLSSKVGTIRIIYLVPNDKEINALYAQCIQEAAKNIQIWYRNQLDGKTFELNDPIVEIYQTSHDASWYSTNPNGDFYFYFWNNVLEDAAEVTNYHAADEDYIYVFYIDADPACNQGGGLGTIGTVVISANDLRGLSGGPWVPVCPDEDFNFQPCRFVGGLGHELGHAFGLSHPPGCDQGEPTCDYQSIMSVGLYDYPDCYFNSDEKEILNQNDFIKPINLTSTLPNCNTLPVELTSFTGKVLGNNIHLYWETATEVNNFGFDIERKKKKQVNWEKISFIQGFGNSNVSHKYKYIDENLPAGDYAYKLKQIDTDGKFEYSEIVFVTVTDKLSFDLMQNYPNPFNPVTEIIYSIPAQSNYQNEIPVLLKVYDVLGNEVQTLVNKHEKPGIYHVKFKPTELPTGVYFYELSVGNFSQVKKMLLVK